jgi:predicted metalloprotease
MLWRGRRQSDNIEDERSDSGGGLGGGLGGGGQFRVPIGGRTGGGGSILLVILVVLAGWYFGFDPSQILGGGDSSLKG